jgi:hypothetical protein
MGEHLVERHLWAVDFSPAGSIRSYYRYRKLFFIRRLYLAVIRMSGDLWRKAKQRSLDREISLQKLLTEALEEKLKKESQ